MFCFETKSSFLYKVQTEPITESTNPSLPPKRTTILPEPITENGFSNGLSNSHNDEVFNVPEFTNGPEIVDLEQPVKGLILNLF